MNVDNENKTNATVMNKQIKASMQSHKDDENKKITINVSENYMLKLKTQFGSNNTFKNVISDVEKASTMLKSSCEKSHENVPMLFPIHKKLSNHKSDKNVISIIKKFCQQKFR